MTRRFVWNGMMSVWAQGRLAYKCSTLEFCTCLPACLWPGPSSPSSSPSSSSFSSSPLVADLNLTSSKRRSKSTSQTCTYRIGKKGTEYFPCHHSLWNPFNQHPPFGRLVGVPTTVRQLLLLLLLLLLSLLVLMLPTLPHPRPAWSPQPLLLLLLLLLLLPMLPPLSTLPHAPPAWRPKLKLARPPPLKKRIKNPRVARDVFPFYWMPFYFFIYLFNFGGYG